MPNDHSTPQRNVAYSSGRSAVQQKSSSSSLRSSHHAFSKKSASNTSTSTSLPSSSIDSNSSFQSSSGLQAHTNSGLNSSNGAHKVKTNSTIQSETPKHHIIPALSFYDTFALFFLFLQFHTFLRIAIHVAFIFILSPSISTNFYTIVQFLKKHVWPFSWIFGSKLSTHSKAKKNSLDSKDDTSDFENLKDTTNNLHTTQNAESSKLQRFLAFKVIGSFFKIIFLDFLVAITTIYLTPILKNVVLVFSTAIVAASLGGGPHPIIHAVYATSVVEVTGFFINKLQMYWEQGLPMPAIAPSSLSDTSSLDLTAITSGSSSELQTGYNANIQQSQATQLLSSKQAESTESTKPLFSIKNQGKYIPEAAFEAASSIFSDIVKQSLSAATTSVATLAFESNQKAPEGHLSSTTLLPTVSTSGAGFNFPLNLDEAALGLDQGASARGRHNGGYADPDQSFNTITSVANLIPKFVCFVKHYNWKTDFPVLMIQMISIYVIWLALKQYLSSSSHTGVVSSSNVNSGSGELMDYTNYEDADCTEGNGLLSEDNVYRDVMEIKVEPSVSGVELTPTTNESANSENTRASTGNHHNSTGWNSLFGLRAPMVSANAAVNKRTALAFKRMSLTRSNQPLWATIAYSIVMATNLTHLPGGQPKVEDESSKNPIELCFLDTPEKEKPTDGGLKSNESAEKAGTDTFRLTSGVFVVYIFQTVVGLVVTNVRYPVPSHYSVRVNQVFWKQLVVKPLNLTDSLMSVVPQDSEQSNEPNAPPNSIFIAIHGLPAGAVYEIDVYFTPPGTSKDVLIGQSSLCTNIPYEGYYQFSGQSGASNTGNSGNNNSSTLGNGTTGFSSTNGSGNLTGIGGTGSNLLPGSGTVAPPSRPLSPVTTLLDSFTQMVTVLSQTRESSKKMKKEHSKRIASLKADIEAAKSKKESLEKSDDRFRRRGEELHETITILKSDIQSLHSQVEELEIQDKEVNKKYEDATKSYDAKMKSAMATRSREKQAEAKMRKQLDEVKADEAVLNTKRDKVLARKHKLEADTESISKEVEDAVEAFLAERKKAREKKQQRRKLVATEFSDSIDKMEKNVLSTQTKTTELWTEVQARAFAIQQAQQLGQSLDQTNPDNLNSSPISPLASHSPQNMHIQPIQQQQQSYGYPISSTHSGHSIPLTSTTSPGGGIATARSFGSVGGNYGSSLVNSSSFSVSGNALAQMAESKPLFSGGLNNSSPNVTHSHLGPISSPIAAHPITGPFVSTINNNSSHLTQNYNSGSININKISGPISGPFPKSSNGDPYSGYISGTITGPPVFPYPNSETSPIAQSPQSFKSTLQNASDTHYSPIPHNLGPVGSPATGVASLAGVHGPTNNQALGRAPAATNNYVAPVFLSSTTSSLSAPQNVEPSVSLTDSSFQKASTSQLPISGTVDVVKNVDNKLET